MAAWKKGLRVHAAFDTTSTGTVVWVGKTSRGSLRVGVKKDSNGAVVFFSPGKTIYSAWTITTEA